MPRNYRLPKVDKLYGEANALTIATCGRDKLNKALHEFRLPIMAQWMHSRTDIESLWQDGSLRNAVAYFVGKLRATGRDITREIVVPLVVRKGKILEPAMFRASEHTDIWTKDAMDSLFTGHQFPRPLGDGRDYVFGLPPLPGTVPPNRQMIDTYKPLIGRQT